jgi:hypothetical protein
LPIISRSASATQILPILLKFMWQVEVRNKISKYH